ncbi:MAG: peptide chain release factor 2 [Proteobacteria bacterium]|nr:peptide chain release factor 2 [Candidatus Fonsibacter sp. PEL4]
MIEIRNIAEKIGKSLDNIRGYLDKNQVVKKISELTAQTELQDFWSNQKNAEKVIKDRNFLLEIKNNYDFISKEHADNKDLLDIVVKESDELLAKDLNKSFENNLEKLKKIELLCFLSNENDTLDAYVEIHAGAGGTESQDWAEMLRRMYSRWAEKNNFKVELIHESRGEEAGIKSSTIKISGQFIYGWLKRESGVHRLVRISPFDSGARRHTSFASAWIYPVVNEDINIEILEKDIRIDTYRSSGAGGQHVNTTDSAVRITHIETGIVAQCQNERSQHKNKETAMNMLKARLYELEMQKKQKDSDNLESSKKEIGWGSQIRNYVLQPYQLVKDNRTNIEVTNPEKVLDGDIAVFLEASVYQGIH